MLGWSVLITPSSDGLEVVGAESMGNAIAQLEIDDENILNRAAEEVVTYAENRAAEMVGMKYTDVGDLIVNPNPKWAITDATRDELKGLINNAIETGQSRDQLAKSIRTSDKTFSRARAKNIAQTELNMAHSKTNEQVWRSSGKVAGRIWLLSNDHGAFVAEYGPDPCDDNARKGEVKMGKAFPSGHMSPPAHNQCKCDEAAVLKS